MSNVEVSQSNENVLSTSLQTEVLSPIKIISPSINEKIFKLMSDWKPDPSFPDKLVESYSKFGNFDMK